MSASQVRWLRSVAEAWVEHFAGMWCCAQPLT